VEVLLSGSRQVQSYKFPAEELSFEDSLVGLSGSGSLLSTGDTFVILSFPFLMVWVIAKVPTSGIWMFSVIIFPFVLGRHFTVLLVLTTLLSW